MVFEVTPWDVKGNVDYKKLIKEFGIKPITPKLLDKIKAHTKDLHIFLKRGIFFAHRDLDWILNKYKNGEKFYLYTGRGPTESMHIGHLVPMMFTKWLQEKFKTKVYLQFTDDEKFLFKKHLDLEEIESFTRENIIDILALGFEEKNTIVIQDTKHINYLYEEAIKVSRNVTFSMVKATFGLKDSSNIGQIFYTSLQAVPAFLESKIQGKNVPCLIPLGVDQDPHFRITRDVAPKLGYYKPAIIHSKFMPSLRGDDKMSSSKPEACIFLTDDEVYSDEVYIDSLGDFHGWAWSDKVIGWISFNSSDSGAGGASYKVSIEISNQPPVADAGGPYIVQENDTKQLDGTGSNDPDGNIVSYTWSGECAPYLDDVNKSQPIFAAPEVSSDTNYSCTLEVTDNKGATDSDTTTIQVKDTAPVCGNNIIEGDEECEVGPDGLFLTDDDINCPGKCKPDCTCKKWWKWWEVIPK